jgi:hypothetical protein
MPKVPEPIRELRPHAIWSGVELVWRLLEAVVFTSLIAMFGYLQAHVAIASGMVFILSFCVLTVAALRRSRVDAAEYADQSKRGDQPRALAKGAALLPAGVALKLQRAWLDGRATDPKIIYKAKLRLIFTNDSNQVIHVNPLSWITGHDDVPLQFPLGYKYQIELSPGSWTKDQWSPQELLDVQVSAGGSFRLYVGLDQSVPQGELEKRQLSKRLGTLVMPIKIAGKDYVIEERL